MEVVGVSSHKKQKSKKMEKIQSFSLRYSSAMRDPLDGEANPADVAVWNRPARAHLPSIFSFVLDWRAIGNQRLIGETVCALKNDKKIEIGSLTEAGFPVPFRFFGVIAHHK